MRLKLEPGDIFRVPAGGIAAWANAKFTAPPTRWFHYGLIWMPYDGDWITIDSSTESNGVNVGLLSWYLRNPGDEMSILRADIPEDLRHAAPLALIPYARSKYGYIQVIRLILSGIGAAIRIFLTEFGSGRLWAKDFPDMLDRDAPICTRAVEIAYLAVGAPIIDPRYPAIPAAFEEAVLEGVLKEIYYIKKGDGNERK